MPGVRATCAFLVHIRYATTRTQQACAYHYDASMLRDGIGRVLCILQQRAMAAESFISDANTGDVEATANALPLLHMHVAAMHTSSTTYVVAFHSASQTQTKQSLYNQSAALPPPGD